MLAIIIKLVGFQVEKNIPKEKPKESNTMLLTVNQDFTRSPAPAIVDGIQRLTASCLEVGQEVRSLPSKQLRYLSIQRVWSELFKLR